MNFVLVRNFYNCWHFKIYDQHKVHCLFFLAICNFCNACIHLHFQINLNKDLRFSRFVVYKINVHQNISIIISTKYVNDHKCPFNRDSLDHEDSFNSLSNARSCNVNRWFD